MEHISKDVVVNEECIRQTLLSIFEKGEVEAKTVELVDRLLELKASFASLTDLIDEVRQYLFLELKKVNGNHIQALSMLQDLDEYEKVSA